jgi:hypothetical protein
VPDFPGADLTKLAAIAVALNDHGIRTVPRRRPVIRAALHQADDRQDVGAPRAAVDSLRN